MGVNKVIYEGKTLIDITSSTVSPETLLKGSTAFNAAGDLIEGNAETSYLSGAEPVILVDEDGNEIAAVITDEEVSLTATANDVRIGTTVLTDDGLITGEKVIPAYHSTEGYRLIPPGSAVIIPNIDTTIDSYDYTKLQSMICLFNTESDDSVYTEKVTIGENVYNVKSLDAISTIEKDHDTKNINLGIINDSDISWIIRFFMYKEII